MKNLKYYTDEDYTIVVNKNDEVFLEIPNERLLLYIEHYNLNGTGETYQDHFEERDDDGNLSYSLTDIEIFEDVFEYLQENTEEVVTRYLKEILDGE